MTWRVPTWWSFVLLTLAAYRLVRLIGWDDLTAPIRHKVYGMTDYDYHELAHAVDELTQKQKVDPWKGHAAIKVMSAEGVKTLPLPTHFRFDAAKLGHCPHCLSVWVGVFVWLAWLVSPHWALVAATPLAIAATASLVAVRLDP